MATLGEIEKLTKDYADSRDRLCGTVRELEQKMGSTKRQYLPGIRTQVRIAKEKKANLEAALQDSGNLFVKPRTIIIAGIKIGFEKARGIISWTDDAAVVRPHPRAIGIEDADDTRIQLVIAMIRQSYSLGEAFRFVINPSRSHRVHVPPVVLRLRAHFRIPIDF